ncbi:GntR family transcriptional regulator, partial [Staphylococcus capitis]|uniref:GntR family transcriptional regulator n=1 Tax=Staphylococcus capitis TaxID=29388 RepID=UPI000D46F1C9
MSTTQVSSSKGAIAYTELRRRTLSGDLAPGSRLSQYDLAEEMGMSITPLREAVRQLASEEWVEVDT